MNMPTVSRSSKIAHIIQQRRPLAQKIERVTANLHQLETALNAVENQRNELLARVDDPSTTGRLREVDFAAIQRGIGAELEALKTLRSRFARSTLNIGVVGRARQGKSRLLQSLTGLSREEIPDGDRQHCTGVRSTIHHNPDVDTYGEVFFHSEQSFLNDVIAPYYEQLRLGPAPRSIEAFASAPLPALSTKNLGGQAEPKAKYEHLRKYHTHIDQYREALFEAAPRRITRDQIREYVAQDTVDGERSYFNYLAVREVKITCTFPNADVGQIALVDMPGLGDTGIGDAERMIKILGQDIDMVLFVRMPKAGGDFLGDVDIALYDMACSALIDLPIQEWSFMVLNHMLSPDNYELCQDFQNELLTQKHITVQQAVIANCAEPTAAQTEVLDPVLNYLAQRIEVLDRQYATVCQDRLQQLQNLTEAELKKAEHAWKLASRDNWFPEYLPLFRDLWRNLTRELENLVSDMLTERDIEDINLQQAVEEAIADLRESPDIPTMEDIKAERDCAGSYEAAYAKCLHEVRTHLSKRFLSLDLALETSLEAAKARVVQVLKQSGRLEKLAEGHGSAFLGNVTECIPDKLERLKLGFHVLATFELQYRGLIQHRIRQFLDVLVPDRTPFQLIDPHHPQPQPGFFERLEGLFVGSLETHQTITPRTEAERLAEISTNLQKAHTQAVDGCEEALLRLLSEPTQASFAIVEEFVDQVLRAEGVEDEWMVFLQEFAADIWPNEFASTMAQARLHRNWRQVLDQASEVSQTDTFNLLR